jgi:CDP-paratose 2-epimerase
MLEAMDAAEGLTGKRIQRSYVDENRKGDHICYISDMNKFRSHFPGWSITKPLAHIYNELVEGTAHE